MKPDYKKVASRKAMRVATVFTGAAACVTAFAPGAAAYAGHYAAIGQPGHLARLDSKGLEAQPDTRVSGNIQSGACGGRPNWVHFEIGAATICFGSKGQWEDYDPGYRESKICGGNNFGWYSGKSENSRYNTAGFHPGTNFVHLPWPGSTYITYVVISSWAGTQRC
jgi:hypothetical protein